MVPGLIHDYGYRYNMLWGIDEESNTFKYQENAGKKHWDKLFRDVATQVNGLWMINVVAWMTVLAFGWWSWWERRKQNERPTEPDMQAFVQFEMAESHS